MNIAMVVLSDYRLPCQHIGAYSANQIIFGDVLESVTYRNLSRQSSDLISFDLSVLKDI